MIGAMVHQLVNGVPPEDLKKYGFDTNYAIHGKGVYPAMPEMKPMPAPQMPEMKNPMMPEMKNPMMPEMKNPMMPEMKNEPIRNKPVPIMPEEQNPTAPFTNKKK